MTVLVYHRPEDVKRLCLCCRHSDVTEITKSLTHISHDTTEQLVALRKLKKWFLLFSQFCNVNNIEYYQAASETLKSWDQCRFLGCRKMRNAPCSWSIGVCLLLVTCLPFTRGELSWRERRPCSRKVSVSHLSSAASCSASWNNWQGCVTFVQDKIYECHIRKRGLGVRGEFVSLKWVVFNKLIGTVYVSNNAASIFSARVGKMYCLLVFFFEGWKIWSN